MYHVYSHYCHKLKTVSHTCIMQQNDRAVNCYQYVEGDFAELQSESYVAYFDNYKHADAQADNLDLSSTVVHNES